MRQNDGDGMELERANHENVECDSHKMYEYEIGLLFSKWNNDSEGEGETYASENEKNHFAGTELEADS